MQTGTPEVRDAAKSRESSQAGAGGNQLADLLSSSELGARVKGLLLAVDEPKHWPARDGMPASYSRRLQLFAGAGAGAVICGERAATLEEFKPLQLGLMVDAPILGAKTEGKQMVFRIKL